MAYEVTATRRRPQLFDELIGQEFVVATLKNAINTGKIAHAYLFSGPRGCGKTTSARLLAKALNCEKGPSATPCGECAACKEIARGSSLDVIEIDGASNTSVNDVRQIKDEVLFPPNSCRYKIYIIDEVHMLSTSAFNALLKTIEEPPPYVVFIFATTELHKVPATIKSRCQQFLFRLGSVEQIHNMLAAASAEIGIKADDEALYWVAREATGSFRDAYTLFDQVAAFSDGHITYEKIRDKLGLVGLERLNELCEDCVDGNTGAALEKIDTILQGGVSIEQFISNFADYIRSLLLIHAGITREALIGQSVSRFSQKVINAWTAVQLERALSLFLQLFRDVRYSLNQRFELELAISRLCWLSSYVSVVEVKKAIESAKALLGSAPKTSLQQNGTDETVGSSPVRPPIPQFSALKDIEGGKPPFQYSGHQLEKEEPLTDSSSEIAEKNSNVEHINIENLDVDALRDAVIQNFSISNTLLATALMQTEGWSCVDKVLTIGVKTEFQKAQMTRDMPTIRDELKHLTDSNFQIVIDLIEEPLVEEDKVDTRPELVKIICDTFCGTCISEKKEQRVEQKQDTIVREEGTDEY